MACTPAITIDVQVVSVGPPPSATFSLEPSAGNGPITVSPQGTIDLSQVHTCVHITMKLQGYTFYRQYNAGGHLTEDAISFADNPSNQKKPVLPTSNHLQFSPLPFVRSNNNQTIDFDYTNTNSCNLHKTSEYGIYLANSSGNSLGQIDPIVSNGDNNALLCGAKRRHHHGS